MLRHTFAVEWLLDGFSLEDVSKLLTHKSIRVTEKYYAPWVRSRQEQLDQKVISAPRRMGPPSHWRPQCLDVMGITNAECPGHLSVPAVRME
jgi:hypothetical protein